MPHIAPIKWRQFVRFVESEGWKKEPAKSTGHLYYMKEGSTRPVVIPTSHNEMRVYEVRNNIKTMGINPNEYLKKIGKA